MPSRSERLLDWPSRWLKQGSLKRRLLLAVVVPMAGVLLCTMPLDYRTARRPAEQAYDETLANQGFALATQLRVVDGVTSLPLERQAEEILRSDGIDDEYYSVRDSQGRILVGEADLPAIPPDLRDNPAFYNAVYRDQPVRVVVFHKLVSGEKVVIQVAETLRKREATEQRILTAMVLPNLIQIVVALLIMYFAVRLALKPLDRLGEDIGRRSSRDLAPVQVLDAPDEVAPLVNSLNHLFELLTQASLAQQRFLANAAHQLRTPLTGLRTQIELAAIEGAFKTAPERLARLEEGLGQLGHLIDQVLTLSRADPSATHAQTEEPVDLADMLERNAMSFIDRAVARGIDLGYELSPAKATGIAWLLREMAANLIDNALRYTQKGGTVTVQCGTRNGAAWLAVEDDGPGIAETERDKVFARFYRGESQAGDGSGLGLAIVREICSLHRASVTVQTPANGQGVRLLVQFPTPEKQIVVTT
jgi:two-component system sensor histidine kinase TctE